MTQAIFWFVVGVSATLAIYSSRVHDTLAERAALAIVALTSFAAGYRAWTGTYVPSGDISLAVAMAIYAVVIVHKNSKVEPASLPKDKCNRTSVWASLTKR